MFRDIKKFIGSPEPEAREKERDEGGGEIFVHERSLAPRPPVRE